MSSTAPPAIVVDQPNTTTSSSSKPYTNGTSIPSINQDPPRPTTPQVNTAAATAASPKPKAKQPLLSRPQSALTTSPDDAHCYLCDEQNPGDFAPTTKLLETCLCCSRYFCKIHQSASLGDTVCNINHATYYHDMLDAAKSILRSQGHGDVMSPVEAGAVNGNDSKLSGGRKLAEMLIAEGIFPSIGEREKAIFATSPVDDSKQRELESFRSMDAAVRNGGDMGKKMKVEEKNLVGADIAV